MFFFDFLVLFPAKLPYTTLQNIFESIGSNRTFFFFSFSAPQHNHGPLDPRLFPTIQQQENNNSNHHGKNPNKNPVLQRSKTQYDWRQDTPFWNKPRSLKPQVPANKPKLSREEPWTHLHATAGAGPSSLWPGGQHGYPGLFLGNYVVLMYLWVVIYIIYILSGFNNIKRWMLLFRN